jgi:hypothetical protein
MFYGGSGVGVTGTANLTYNTSLNQIGFNASVSTGTLSFSPTASSSGTTGTYTYYVCTQNTTITPSSTISNVKYFAVGGGGQGAGNVSGGGGAGGLRTNDPLLSGSILGSQYDSGGLTLTGSTAYTVTIGAGGQGAGAASSGANGTSTVFAVSGGATIATAVGGGGGVVYGSTPVSGGCGGGGGSDGGAAGTGTQGYNGGVGVAGGGGYIGGGGGGIGGAGQNYTANVGGVGGLGLQYYLNGGKYGGGGGGSSFNVGGPGGPGIGGAGGSVGGTIIGGTGANAQSAGNGSVGATNTGSGGGGGQQGSAGFNGGSGVFIIAIPTPGSPSSINCANIGLTGGANNLIITTPNSITMSAGTGTVGLSMTNLASVSSATPSGFYRMLYNPTSGQIVYDTALSP